MMRNRTLGLILSGIFCMNLAVSAEEVVETEVINLTALETQKVLSEEKDQLVIVDIRTPKEFKAGHLENALNIDFKAPDFKDQLTNLDTEKAYLFYCRSGGRSSKSIPVWKDLGFKKIYHLKTGYNGWKKLKN